MNSLKLYREYEAVEIPKFATEGSACFDIKYFPHGKQFIKGFDRRNAPIEREISMGNILITSGDRLLIPTGLWLDIPEGFSVRIHPRSGLSLKSGLVLANAEGVIDSDYTDELFILMTNYSDNRILINIGDRVAQGELVESVKYDLSLTTVKPTKKTNRDGGFGSTGTNDPIRILPAPAKEPVEEPQKPADGDPVVKRGRGRPRKNPAP